MRVFNCADFNTCIHNTVDKKYIQYNLCANKSHAYTIELSFSITLSIDEGGQQNKEEVCIIKPQTKASGKLHQV